MKITITGGIPLHGEVEISGSKNTCLPILCASCIFNKPIILGNLPNIHDVRAMLSVVQSLGVDVYGIERNSDENNGKKLTNDRDLLPIITKSRYIMVFPASLFRNDYSNNEHAKKMRASIWLLPALLHKFGSAKIALPGGCKIGERPIDLHIFAMEQLGAKYREVETETGFYAEFAVGEEGLVGGDINFHKYSVGATENAILAASCASGITTITNAAREPEVIHLCEFLIKHGIQINGIGESVITIVGNPKLLDKKAGDFTDEKTIEDTYIIPADRIEAASYAIAAVATGGSVTLTNVDENIFAGVSEEMGGMGIKIEQLESGVFVSHKLGDGNKLYRADISTGIWPNFPTDLQPIFTSALCLAVSHPEALNSNRKTSEITENIFENRFQYAEELRKFGADIKIKDKTCFVTGVGRMHGANVVCSELRGSKALIIAALTAKGTSEITNLEYLDRGYEDIVNKLRRLGAKISRGHK